VQPAPLHSGSNSDPDWTTEEGKLLATMLAIDGLMPRHRLSPNTIGAAAVAVRVLINGGRDALTQCFAEMTTLKPDRIAYKRAEFRNVLYALHRHVRKLLHARRAPALFVLYEFLSAAGAGPHPDPELPRKWRDGMPRAERDQRERQYKSWANHLRNRICLVKRAIDPRSDMSERQRRSVVGADPLIARDCMAESPRQTAAR